MHGALELLDLFQIIFRADDRVAVGRLLVPW